MGDVRIVQAVLGPNRADTDAHSKWGLLFGVRHLRPCIRVTDQKLVVHGATGSARFRALVRQHGSEVTMRGISLNPDVVEDPDK